MKDSNHFHAVVSRAIENEISLAWETAESWSEFKSVSPREGKLRQHFTCVINPINNFQRGPLIFRCNGIIDALQVAGGIR